MEILILALAICGTSTISGAALGIGYALLRKH